MSVFDEIKTGLEQAIEYEKGNLQANTRTLSILPIEEFSAQEIKTIRKNAGLTQVLFAKYLGVSLKTVEAWEAGRNQPSGSASRLLSITKNDPRFPRKSGIVS
ncbi:MAG: helix-turn-helix domain-containing protein [Clostridia bacterium]|nr:helix-turn-helix domain-containing protein [Clostridia bacterium]